MDPRLNVNLLSQLVVLVEEGHVSRAAQKLDLSQPTMSASLARLRKIFGDPILVRTSGGMAATDRAREIAERVRTALELLETSGSGDREFDAKTDRTHFRVLVPEAIARPMVPLLAARMRKEAPNTSLSMSSAELRRTADRLRDGAYDVSIHYLSRMPLDLHCSRLLTQRILCIASRAHPSIRGKIGLRQLVDCQHVVWGVGPAPEGSLEQVIDEALGKRGLSRERPIRLPNVLDVPAVVAASDLVALVPERVALASAETLPIQVLRPPLRLENAETLMYWHERTHSNAAHAWFRKLLREVAAACGPQPVKR